MPKLTKRFVEAVKPCGQGLAPVCIARNVKATLVISAFLIHGMQTGQLLSKNEEA
jgi:hypothetical protein